MEKQIITFSANEQRLIKTGGIECYASNIVSYIEAHFDLGANWSGYDSVRAVWSNDNNMTVISTVLDSNGVCVVPFEVLKTKGIIKVNLVGSISVSDVLTDRLTTFPCEAVKVTAKAKTDGSETQPITPSQFEQFVAAVISEVEKVTGMTAQAETLPAGSQATARYENGILYLGIPQGIQGERGETGADGNGIASVVYNADYSLTLVFDNGERFTTPPIRGERGPAGADGRDGTDGRDGADGVTPSLSVGTVTTLPSTEDAYVTRRGTDENPVFDFGIPQGPKGDKGDTGEVSLSDLSSLLPTDTASGSIASFPDGTDLFPALSVKAQIEPIQSGSGTPSPDNVRPISGRTEVDAYVVGKNLFDGTWLNGYWDVDTAQFVSSSNWRATPKFKANVGDSYYVSKDGAEFNASGRLLFFNGDTAIDGGYTRSHFTLPSGYDSFAIYTGTTTASGNFTIAKYSGTPSYAYEPYNGTTYTTSLGQTVYGGTLDVVSGELVVDKVFVTLDGTQPIRWTDWRHFDNDTSAWLYGVDKFSIANSNDITCDKLDTVEYVDIYSGNVGIARVQASTTYSFGVRVPVGGLTTDSAINAYLAENPIEVVYPLATPLTYQLTPTEIELLQGQNNVWTDCGSVEVTYKADVGLYIDKKLSSNGTRSLSMGLTKSATAEAETEAEPSKTETETETR